MEISFTNLFGVSLIAFAVPFLLGFVPRLRIPAVVLELVAGIVFGPAVLGWVQLDEVVAVMATVGVAFLLFLAGLELDFDELRGRPLKRGATAFVLSVIIAIVGALAIESFFGSGSPFLVGLALASTSVGIVIPVLKDTGQLDSGVGTFVVAGGSAAEFGSILLLGIFFAAPIHTAQQELLVVTFTSVMLAALAVVLGVGLFLVSRIVRWRAGRGVVMRLDPTSSQLRVRFAVMLLLGTAAITASFGFEAILGTFLAGIFLAGLVRGTPDEKVYRSRLEGMGFGFFVPVFFVSSGMRLSVEGMFTPSALAQVALFLILLLLARGLPALLYRRYVSHRGAFAAALMLATNVSFVVVAVSVGLELEMIEAATGSALVLAGLLSAVVFPAAAQAVLESDTPAA